jgi:hypothetical protein
MTPEQEVIEYLRRKSSEEERLALWFTGARYQVVLLFFDEFCGDVIAEAETMSVLADTLRSMKD